jgi:hypothetical protein
MGRSDPASVAAANVSGGTNATVLVKFEDTMSAGAQDPVTYDGDVEVLENPPTQCPWPASQYGCDQTTFQVVTKAVTSPKSVTVTVHGPTTVKKTTFVVSPG